MGDALILSDPAVKALLRHFNRDDVEMVKSALIQGLKDYSTKGTEAEASKQPHRAVVVASTGQVTLFMPAITKDVVGNKIIGVPPPRSSTSSADTAAGGIKATAPTGVLTLLNAAGKLIGVINAEEFTAFRTSLGSMILYPYRKETGNIVVFGAGKQAIWHIRLALLLRGPEIKRITIVNRSLDRSEEMLLRLKEDDQSKWRSPVEFDIVDPSRADYMDFLRELLAQTDVVFSCTPSKQALVPPDFLISSDPSKQRNKYITAIGSYTPDMIEIHSDVLHSAIQSKDGFHLNGGERGSVVVDSRDACMIEAGEIIQGHISPDNLIEVGEVCNSLESIAEVKDKSRLNNWLESGLVIYKSVGTGVMDLAVAGAVLPVAKEKGFGVNIPDF